VNSIIKESIDAVLANQQYSEVKVRHAADSALCAQRVGSTNMSSRHLFA
jgi:hypothetical protein